MNNIKIRVPAYERTCMLTGRPLQIQYAINDAGVLWRRGWIKPIIVFAEPRKGHWDKWEKLGADYKLPVDAKATGKFVVVYRG